MKNIFLVMCFIAITPLVYSNSNKIIEQINEFGGITSETTYTIKKYGAIDSERLYYDKSNALIKSISRFSTDKILETGIVFQEQQYKNSKIIAYKMYLSDSEKNICGYDYFIEYMDENDKVVSCAYGYGEQVVKQDINAFSYSYPFLNLNYLFDVIYEEYEPNAKGDKITISARYYRGRSLVEIVSNIMPMDLKDKEIAGYFFSTFNSTGLDVYNYKVVINEKGKEYVMYIQDSLLPYITKSYIKLISFVVVGFNHNLYPLVTSLIDVK